jgi:hypothetical protein
VKDGAMTIPAGVGVGIASPTEVLRDARPVS